MEKVENTHIVTACKIEKIKTLSEELLVCIPIEVSEGRMTSSKKFVDKDGTELIPAYDAYLRGLKTGYILEMSYKDILSRGKRVLVQTLGYEYAKDEVKDEEQVIQNYKDEYVAQLEELTWYYDLDEVVPVLSPDDNEDFYDLYHISIDRDRGSITTKEPKPTLTNEEYRKLEEELEENYEVDVTTPKKEEEKPKTKITRVGLISETKKYVIAQDEAIGDVVSAIYNPICLGEPKMKQNILVYGPTGVGKTFILEIIAKMLEIPFFYTSVADFSSSGYIGQSVDDIYAGLYNAAGRDISKLEKGAIVFIDEIDKLILSDTSGSDVKSQVYNELLPLYQHDGEVTFKSGEHGKSIKYNKEKLIIVSAGSFARMNEMFGRKAGFGENKEAELQRYYSKKDFVKFGVPEEFMGRQDLCIPLNALTEEDLYNILLNSLKSPYVITTNALKLKGITLNISDAVLRKMANKAYTLKSGARSLRGVFNFSMQNILDHIVDRIDEGILQEPRYDVSDEQVVKRLERYNG